MATSSSRRDYLHIKNHHSNDSISRTESMNRHEESERDLFVTPSTLEVDYDINITPLYQAITDQNWQYAIEVCKSDPIQAATWVVRHYDETSSQQSNSNKDSNIMWRFLPLHSACARQPPGDVTKALILAYPDGTRCIDDQGMYPLHYACGNQAPLDAIRLLLNHFPKAASISDPREMLPLHYIACWGPSSLQVVDTLITANPAAIHVKDIDGNTPVDLAFDGDYAEKDALIKILKNWMEITASSDDSDNRKVQPRSPGKASKSGNNSTSVPSHATSTNDRDSNTGGTLYPSSNTKTSTSRTSDLTHTYTSSTKDSTFESNRCSYEATLPKKSSSSHKPPNPPPELSSSSNRKLQSTVDSSPAKRTKDHVKDYSPSFSSMSATDMAAGLSFDKQKSDKVSIVSSDETSDILNRYHDRSHHNPPLKGINSTTTNTSVTSDDNHYQSRGEYDSHSDSQRYTRNSGSKRNENQSQGQWTSDEECYNTDPVGAIATKSSKSSNNRDSYGRNQTENSNVGGHHTAHNWHSKETTGTKNKNEDDNYKNKNDLVSSSAAVTTSARFLYDCTMSSDDALSAVQSAIDDADASMMARRVMEYKQQQSKNRTVQDQSQTSPHQNLQREYDGIDQVKSSPRWSQSPTPSMQQHSPVQTSPRRLGSSFQQKAIRSASPQVDGGSSSRFKRVDQLDDKNDNYISSPIQLPVVDGKVISVRSPSTHTNDDGLGPVLSTVSTMTSSSIPKNDPVYISQGSKGILSSSDKLNYRPSLDLEHSTEEKKDDSSIYYRGENMVDVTHIASPSRVEKLVGEVQRLKQEMNDTEVIFEQKSIATERSWKAEIDILRRKLRRKDEELNETKEQLNERTEEKAQADNELSLMREQLQQTETELEITKTSLKDCKAECKGLSVSLGDLMEQHEKMKKRSNKITERFTTLKVSLDCMKTQHNSIVGAVNERNAKLLEANQKRQQKLKELLDIDSIVLYAEKDGMSFYGNVDDQLETNLRKQSLEMDAVSAILAATQDE